MNAPIIEWTGEHVLALIELRGIGCLRFIKYGAECWYGEALELSDGHELGLSDRDGCDAWDNAPLPEDSQLARILDAALDRLLWKGSHSTITLREHAERTHAVNRADARRANRASGEPMDLARFDNIMGEWPG